MQKNLCYILFIVLLLSACSQTERSTSVIQVIRYDKWQYEATIMNSFLALQKMNTEAPQMTKLLYEEVLTIGDANDPNINTRFTEFFADPFLTKLTEDCEQQFPDLSKIEKQLSHGFGLLQKEIPELRIPKIYSIISALNQSIVVGDSILAFSLDKYMGKDYEPYQRYYYPHQSRNMTPDRIALDCFKYYLLGNFPYCPKIGKHSLYQFIMYRGKIGWIVKKLLNYKHSNADLLGYSIEEIEWCETHRDEVRTWLFQTPLLQRKDPMTIRMLTQPNPSPNINEKDLPPLFGIWIGMELIDNYMLKHPQTTIKQLLEKTDFEDAYATLQF